MGGWEGRREENWEGGKEEGKEGGNVRGMNQGREVGREIGRERGTDNQSEAGRGCSKQKTHVRHTSTHLKGVDQPWRTTPSFQQQ